jgi:thiamine-monophosphate kinase
MIDVSDGLLQDLGHLCRASRCGAVLEAAEVPHAFSLRGLPPRRALSLALGGGEDYELVFTAPRFRESALCRLDRGIRRIGTIVRGRAIRVVDAAGRPLPPVAAGFDHFSRSSLSR